jgi:glycosyltransferase involved in cell wall biosynthesis
MKHSHPLARMILHWFWIVLPVKRSAVVTTISESTKTELLKYVKTDPSKIIVIYVPISPYFVPEPKKFNKEEPLILQVGTKLNKNVIRLAKALSGIRCKLEIVGELDSALREELQRSNIQYVSSKNLSNEEVLNKYRMADIVSFVSTYEGFGMPIVEANAIGRVVVTSNLLSMPEVAGDAAHLVDPFDVTSIRDGIVKVIEDDMYRERLIQNGYRNKERFDVKHIARQFTDIYAKLDQS